MAEYVRADGISPFGAWFARLHAQAAAKVATAVLRLEMGNTSNVKWIGAIGEYRIDWGPGYRIYLGGDGETLILLLGGGTKKGQQADIERAKVMWSEYSSDGQEVSKLPLTREFRQTMIARVHGDPAFAKALLHEAATLFLNGEPEMARLVLRDLVNATLGFERLAAATGKPSKSLHRMLSRQGNPSMDNLAAIIGVLRRTLRGLRTSTVKAA